MVACSPATKRLVERAMEVELTDALGYEPHQEPPGGVGTFPQWVSGRRSRRARGGGGQARDRKGSFDPDRRKRQRRAGFDEKILALSRGRDLQDRGHWPILRREASRDLASRVTRRGLGDVKAWRSVPWSLARKAALALAIAICGRHCREGDQA